MRILLVAATELELKKVLEQLEGSTPNFSFQGAVIDMLTTGVGMLATAYQLTKKLKEETYDLVLNIGICGAFDKKLELGEVVWIKSDVAAEEGAEEGERWLSLADMGLRHTDDPPYSSGAIQVELPAYLENKIDHKGVTAISVNRVLGSETSIQKMKEYHPADVESMEGAAVYYCCAMESVKVLQLRSVSNYVENRNKNNWKIELALSNLADATLNLLKHVKA